MEPSGRQEQVRVFNPSTLEDEVMFSASSLRTAEGAPFSYDSFQWAGDSRHVLFQTDFRPIYRRSGISDYYLYDLESGDLRLMADDLRSAELSPDGSLVGFEREGDLYAYDMVADRVTRLTSTGSDSLFNGVFDWVYEEEFGIAEAWEWSPDGTRIAFWETDQREVPSIAITDWSGYRPDLVEITIPKVGDPNPVVRIGVADVRSGEVRWMDTGIPEEHYVPRIYWTSRPNTLAVVTLNRPQKLPEGTSWSPPGASCPSMGGPLPDLERRCANVQVVSRGEFDPHSEPVVASRSTIWKEVGERRFGLTLD
jgi:dipeptidyl-peptidase-4